MNVLVVSNGDQAAIAPLRAMLADAGQAPVTLSDAADACRLAAEGWPDLVVLAIHRGDWDWPSLLTELQRTTAASVIVLADVGREDDAVRAFELGAVDYVVQPVGARELLARIQARLRGAGAAPTPSSDPSVLRVGPLVLNPAAHTVTHAGRPLRLTATEFRVLQYLMQHAGTVVRPGAVLQAVWGYHDPGGTDVVRQVVFRLRRKLGDAPSQPRLLHTVPGVGVMLKPVDTPALCASDPA